VAGRASLSVRPAIRFAGLAAVVIALHVWVLQWLADTLGSTPLITPMATPMFTRLLKPQAPPPPQAAAPAPRRKKRDTLAAVSTPAPKPAAKPAKPASAPQPGSPASAAQATASASQQPADNTPQAAASSPAASSALASASGASAPASGAAIAAASAPASAASAAAASLDTWPVDTRLSYRLSGWYSGDLTGSARVQWLRQNDRYEVRVELDLTIFVMQFLSQGDVTADTLAPRAYQESRPGRTRVVQLGPDSVVLNDGRTVPKPAGVQDTASQFVELSHRFSTGKDKLVVGGTTSVWLARPGGVDLWTYDVVGRDMLRTSELGTIEAFHLKPRPIANPHGNIYAEIWLAPSLQYLPVRIRITQPPDSYADILVDRIEQR
jgi:hypothetical protein